MTGLTSKSFSVNAVPAIAGALIWCLDVFQVPVLAQKLKFHDYEELLVVMD